MSNHLYLIGNTPLFLLGLKKLLQDQQFPLEGDFLLSNNDFTPVDSQSPFLLLLELGAEYSENLKFCRELLGQYPQARIMILSPDEDDKHIKSFFQMGIKAYALPTIDPESLCQAIRQLEVNQNFIDPRLSQQWIQSTLGLGKKEKVLTRREKEVLLLIVDEYTTKEIAEELYISACTAETHRLNIIQKLGVRNTAGVVREAVRKGWCV